MYEREVVETKIAAYSNIATIELYPSGDCDLCKKEGVAVLAIDTSLDEYALLQACVKCLMARFPKLT